MSITTIIIVVIGILILLKLFSTVGEYAFFIAGFFGCYWLSNYIWDWVCWVLAGFIFVIMILYMWQKVNK